jgi:ABC-type ATPase involved in cell division
MDELLLAVAQRRVAEAEARVTAQALLVADAARWGLDTAQAKATLAVFEQTLRFMREDLARLQAADAARPQQ